MSLVSCTVYQIEPFNGLQTHKTVSNRFFIIIVMYYYYLLLLGSLQYCEVKYSFPLILPGVLQWNQKASTSPLPKTPGKEDFHWGRGCHFQNPFFSPKRYALSWEVPLPNSYSPLRRYIRSRAYLVFRYPLFRPMMPPLHMISLSVFPLGNLSTYCQFISYSMTQSPDGRK